MPPEDIFIDRTPKKATHSAEVKDTGTDKESSYSEEERDQIEKRLRDLGYM